MELTQRELERYARQMLIWGEHGQKQLKKAKVGVLGLGGLGSPVTIYLAVAGVGKLVIADGDSVELSNLNRQVLHWDEDIGKSKAISAWEKLRKFNPDIEVKHFKGITTEENIASVFEGVDCVVDALDNIPSRLVLNKFAVERKIPLFHGAIWGFEGRVTTVIPGKTACLSCIYQAAPPRETFPVVGATPGLTAMIQVMEVIKYLTGKGKLLENELLVIDAEMMEFRKIKLRRLDNCPICSSLNASP